MRREEEAAMMSFGGTSDTGRPSGSAYYGQAAAVTAAELTPPTQLRFSNPGFVANGDLALGQVIN